MNNMALYPIMLVVVVVFMILYQFYKLYKLDKLVSTHILLEINNNTGRTEFVLVEKENHSVSLPNKDGSSRMWVIDKSCVKTTSYPIGGAWRFLKRDIDMVEVDGEDWEPYKVDRDDKHLIGSNRFLGTLVNEKVAMAVAGMGQKIIEKLDKIQGMNPTYMLFGGLCLGAGIVFIAMKVMPMADSIAEMLKKLDIIIKLLGG